LTVFDAETQTVEEFSTSNFVGIDPRRTSNADAQVVSVLPSITNKSLMQIAKDEGMTAEERPIKWMNSPHLTKSCRGHGRGHTGR
jgi:branched-subunit amino acid aminotransferase/4-amino-4-deoxychorismate lyase